MAGILEMDNLRQHHDTCRSHCLPSEKNV